MSRFIFCNAECQYAERRYVECRYAKCRYADCRGAKLRADFFLRFYCLTTSK